MAAEHLYPIAPELNGSGEWIRGARFLPGTVPDGEQLVVCGVGHTLYAHRFSADGTYLGRIERDVANWSDVLAWIGELGLIPATVRVKKFHSLFDDPAPDRARSPNLAIREQPSYFEDGDLGTPGQRQRTLKWWRDLGAFVLFWNTTEHTLDGSGVRFQ